MKAVLDFFTDNFPSWTSILVGGPPAFLWAYLSLCFAGYLKQAKHWRTGYTRKVFHFLTFFTAALVQWFFGTPGVCLFGGMASLVVFYAVFRGAGHPMYEAMAREKDEPHRTYYIMEPYFATLIGGITSNILFGPLAVVGYLVTGLGDAVGEPAGVRFGRHHYKVMSLRKVKSTRSLEGSAAVFLACIVAIVAAVLLSPQLGFSTSLLWMVPLLALAGALVEAVSPHGWDNATMQIVPSYLAWLAL